MRPSLAVVIVSYEVRDELDRCLASLERAGLNRPPHEVVVVDNASTDGTESHVRERFPWVRLRAMADNRGFSAGVNEGARATSAPLLFLLNPDTELPANANEGLLSTFERHPDADAVGFRHADGEGRFQLSVGPEPGFATELLRKVIQGRLDRGDDRVAALCDAWLARPKRIAWVAGSALLVRRAAFDAVGGFDEGYFLYFEDLDFCLRLRAAGKRVLFDPSLTVTHHRGRSAAKAPSRVARAYRESQLRFWRKHRGAAAAALVALYLRLAGKAP